MIRSPGVHAAAVFVLPLALACGSSDQKRAPTPDASTDAGSGGAGTGSGGAVASSGGAPAGGGNSSGGSSGAGGDGGVSDASAEAASDGAIPLSCPGPTSLPDGGVADPGQWRDEVAGQCRSCPATQVRCEELVAPGSGLDQASGVLTARLWPGFTRVVNATFGYSYEYLLPDGGVGFGSGTSPVTVQGNDLKMDLSADLPSGLLRIDRGEFTVTDDCGATYETDRNLDVLYVELTPLPDGGVSPHARCRNLD